MTEWLFSYGTLRREAVQRALFGRSLDGAPDVLVGFTLTPVEITDPAFLARGESRDQHSLTTSRDGTDSIEGMVFELTEDELHAAEEYEPKNFEKREVMLLSGRKAWVFAIGEG